MSAYWYNPNLDPLDDRNGNNNEPGYVSSEGGLGNSAFANANYSNGNVFYSGPNPNGGLSSGYGAQATGGPTHIPVAHNTFPGAPQGQNNQGSAAPTESVWKNIGNNAIGGVGFKLSEIGFTIAGQLLIRTPGARWLYRGFTETFMGAEHKEYPKSFPEMVSNLFSGKKGTTPTPGDGTTPKTADGTTPKTADGTTPKTTDGTAPKDGDFSKLSYLEQRAKILELEQKVSNLEAAKANALDEQQREYERVRERVSKDEFDDSEDEF